VDPFETWQKNSSSLKVVLFVFKIFKMATNMKIKKIKINPPPPQKLPHTTVDIPTKFHEV
jgi:hypothetical protein